MVSVRNTSFSFDFSGYTGRQRMTFCHLAEISFSIYNFIHVNVKVNIAPDYFIFKNNPVKKILEQNNPHSIKNTWRRNT